MRCHGYGMGINFKTLGTFLDHYYAPLICTSVLFHLRKLSITWQSVVWSYISLFDFTKFTLQIILVESSFFVWYN